MVILLVVEDPAAGSGNGSTQDGSYQNDPRQQHSHSHNMTPFKRGPHIDLSYFKSLPGSLKIIQFILILIIKVLPRPPYMDFVVQLTFILTSLWIWIYVFSLNKKYSIHPTWIDLEFFYTVGATFFYVVMTIITFADVSYYVRAAIFGLFTCIAFGVATFFIFKDWQEVRQNRIATTTTQQPAANLGPANNGSGYI